MPKRKYVSVEDLLARPWCYYCERSFDDISVLISHQKIKHLSCLLCNRHLNTAGGLKVHMANVHKENITRIENALPGRESMDIEIFGQCGVPEELLAKREAEIREEYARVQAECRARTGNPIKGSKEAYEMAERAKKKPKIDDEDQKAARRAEVQRRLQALKAKKAAAAAAQNGTTPPVDSTPPTEVQNQATEGKYEYVSDVIHGFNPSIPATLPVYPSVSMSGAPGYPPMTTAYGMPQSMYSAAGAMYGAMSAPYPQSSSPFAPMGYNGVTSPMPPMAPDYASSPGNYQQPSWQNGGFPPAQRSSSFGNSPVGFPNYQPPPQNAQQQDFNVTAESSTGETQPPVRKSTLPSAPGLPPRPNFDSVGPKSKEEMELLHRGNPVAFPTLASDPLWMTSTMPKRAPEQSFNPSNNGYSPASYQPVVPSGAFNGTVGVGPAASQAAVTASTVNNLPTVDNGESYDDLQKQIDAIIAGPAAASQSNDAKQGAPGATTSSAASVVKASPPSHAPSFIAFDQETEARPTVRVAKSPNADAPSKSKKKDQGKKSRKTVLVYENNTESPEEVRFHFDMNHGRLAFKAKTTQTTVDTTGGESNQAVTGPVDANFEQ